jgi:glucose/arabinose dehydrogenase
MTGYRFPLLFLIALPILFAVACGGDDTTNSGPTGPTYNFGLDSVVVAGNGDADNVSAIEFAPDGRMFYAIQYKTTDTGDSGIIRVVLPDGSLQQQPFAEFPVANYLGLDWGLTGLALDPAFGTNHYVYAFYTASAGEFIGKPTLVRFTDDNGTGTDMTVITDDFRESFANHQGYNLNGDIHFGPDGYLYVSVGDYDQGTAKPEEGGQPGLVGDLSSPIGKMLRISKEDGSAAPDNPFAGQTDADPRVFASGFREPFPFTFDASGNIYGTDNTPDTCEEINLIKAGQSYGWPAGWEFPFANCAAGQGTQPIYNFAREGHQPGDFLAFVESQGMSFLRNSTYSQLSDGLLVCESQKSLVENTPSPGALVRMTLSGPDTITASDMIVNDCKGDVVAHAGQVYYATQTEIRKLVPASQGGAPTTAGGGNVAPPSLGS